MKDSNKSEPNFFSEKAQRERIREFFKYSPKLESWDFKKSSGLDAYLFKFEYVTDGYKSSYLFPVLSLLPEAQLTPEVEAVKPINAFTSLFSRMNRLPIIAAFGVASIVGLYKTAADLNKYKLGKVGYSAAAGLLARITGLSLSLSYLSIAIFAFVILPILRNRLTARLDHIEHDLRCNLPIHKEYVWSEYEIRLPLIYSIIVSEHFPGNRNLKWRFNYLEARCRALAWRSASPVRKSTYTQALKYSDSADQKFLSLRGMINSAKLWDIKVDYKQDYEEDLKLCVHKISSASKLHQELGASLRTQLQDCLNMFVMHDKCYEAILKFNAINFDAYSEQAFPGAAVLYYQLDAVFTLLGKDNNHLKGMFACDESRMYLVSHGFCMVRKNIDKYYKHLSPLMNEFANNFSNFQHELPSIINPNPGRSITRLFDSNKYFKILSLDSEPDSHSESSIDSDPGDIAPRHRLLCY